MYTVFNLLVNQMVASLTRNKQPNICTLEDFHRLAELCKCCYKMEDEILKLVKK